MKITVDSEIQGKSGEKPQVADDISTECYNIASDFSHFFGHPFVKVTFHLGASNQVFAHFKIAMDFAFPNFPRLGEIEITASLCLKERQELWFTEEDGEGFKIPLITGERRGVVIGLGTGMAKAVSERIKHINSVVKILEAKRTAIAGRAADL